MWNGREDGVKRSINERDEGKEKNKIAGVRQIECVGMWIEGNRAMQ